MQKFLKEKPKVQNINKNILILTLHNHFSIKSIDLTGDADILQYNVCTPIVFRFM